MSVLKLKSKCAINENICIDIKVKIKMSVNAAVDQFKATFHFSFCHFSH